MSRTNKGKKPVGWDYWGKRPIGLGAQGTENKRTGIQRERAILKRELAEEATDPKGDFKEVRCHLRENPLVPWAHTRLEGLYWAIEYVYEHATLESREYVVITWEKAK